MKNLIEAIETSSLRQVAIVVGVNYNMALHASHQPIKGIPYDPDFINVAEIEKLIVKKIGQEEFEQFDWSKCAEHVNHVDVDFMKVFNVGTRFALRNGQVSEIIYRNDEYVVFLGKDTSKPQVMSYATFEHQGPRAINQ